MKLKNRKATRRPLTYFALIFLTASIALVKKAEATQSNKQAQKDLADIATKFEYKCFKTSIFLNLKLSLDSDKRQAFRQACKIERLRNEMMEYLQNDYMENLRDDDYFRDVIEDRDHIYRQSNGSGKVESLNPVNTFTIHPPDDGQEQVIRLDGYINLNK